MNKPKQGKKLSKYARKVASRRKHLTSKSLTV